MNQNAWILIRLFHALQIMGIDSDLIFTWDNDNTRIVINRPKTTWSLYEIIHIWTAVVDESEEWSSQLIFQFKQLERRSLKKKTKKNDSFRGKVSRLACYNEGIYIFFLSKKK